MEKISFIVSNINTLEYSKLCYESIRKNLGNDHEIILLNDNSTDGTKEWIDSIINVDINTQHYHNDSGESIGIAFMYNVGVSLAMNEIICLLHSDMYIPKKFDEIMLKYKKQHDVVTAYRVEPMVYPPSDDKLQLNLGNTIDTFDEDAFNKWSESNIIKNKDVIQNNTCFPWMTTKTIFNSIGGIDLLFLKYMVDDDDFYIRLLMMNYKMIQTKEIAVYHFCSKSSKYKEKDNDINAWNDQYIKSTRNFIRKWSQIQSVYYNKKKNFVHHHTYDIGFIIKHPISSDLLYLLEPWSRSIYIENIDIKSEYLKCEQHRTLFNLDEKIKSIDEPKTNDIIIEFDIQYFTKDHLSLFIMNLCDIISKNITEVGVFEYEIFKITVNKINPIENDNIINTNIEL